MVDVTHDRDDRRTREELGVLLVGELGVEVDVEGPEQLAVLLLGRDHLDDVPELDSERAERVLVQRLRRGRHLTEVEQHRDQAGRVRVDLVGEVVQRRAVTQPHDGLAVATRNLHATERRRLHLLELLALRPLRLASTDGTTTGTTERSLRAAATGATGATAATTGTAGKPTGRCTATGATGATGTPTTRSRATAATRTTCSTRRRATDSAAPGHHAGVRARTAGTRTAGALPRAGRTGGGGALTGATGTGHALRRGERVVPRPRTAGTGCATGRRTLAAARHALGGRERVVPRARTAAAGRSGRRRRGCRCGTRARPGGRRGRCRWTLRFLRGRGGRSGGRRRRGGRFRCALSRSRRLHLGRCRCRCGRRRGRCLGSRGLRGSGTSRSRLGGRLCLRRRASRRVEVAQLAHHRRLDRRRCRANELSELVQLRHHGLAFHSELFGELVDADLGHISPVSVRPGEGRTVVSAGYSSLGTHRCVLIG